MATGTDTINFARSKIGQFYYTNDLDARANPEVSGGTDCSGFVQYAYRTVAGVEVGSWTGAQSSAGREIARGAYPNQIPWDSLQPGDLILMGANYPGDYTFAHYDTHVELYCGGGTMIGHPGGYGPQEKRAQAWMEAYGCTAWMVRRVLEGSAPLPYPVQPSDEVGYYAYTLDGWLPRMNGWHDTGGSADTYAGNGNYIRYLAIDMPGWYQVHTQSNGWLPPVYRCDTADFENGCAGDGSPIMAVRCYYETPDPNATGWRGIEYAVANAGSGFLPNMIDLRDTGGSGDDFAGNFNPITAFRARLVSV